MDPTSVATSIITGGLTVQSLVDLITLFLVLVVTLYIAARARSLVIAIRYRNRHYGPDTIFVVDGNNGLTYWRIVEVRQNYVHAVMIGAPHISRDVPKKHFLEQAIVTMRPDKTPAPDDEPKTETPDNLMEVPENTN